MNTSLKNVGAADMGFEARWILGRLQGLGEGERSDMRNASVGKLPESQKISHGDSGLFGEH